MTEHIHMFGFFRNIGPFEITLIFIAVLLLFGARKLPEIARSIGKSLKEFKKATRDIKKEIDVDTEIEDDAEYTETKTNRTHDKTPPEQDSSQQ